jgi:hypothetical protein
MSICPMDGSLNAKSSPRISIELYGALGRPAQPCVFDAIVDTGFTGAVSIPITQALPPGLATGMDRRNRRTNSDPALQTFPTHKRSPGIQLGGWVRRWYHYHPLPEELGVRWGLRSSADVLLALGTHACLFYCASLLFLVR